MIISMNQILILFGLSLIGLALGSFSGATVWRLRARQLEEDKKEGEKVDKKEYDHLKKLLGKSVNNDRSVCLHCHHQLAWYDLVPLVSWVALRGKCRYCHKPIGYMEPLIELGTAVFFVVSYLVWPVPLSSLLEIINFGLWLIIGVGLIILLAYDMRWFLLPDKIMFPLMGLAVVFALLQLIPSGERVIDLMSLILAATILSGLYYSIYVISRGQWIGFGDVKLGLVLALVLGQWPFAFMTLLFANLIGCFIVLPGLLTKKIQRSSHVPFGPMLILAYFIVGLFGDSILAWYMNFLSL